MSSLTFPLGIFALLGWYIPLGVFGIIGARSIYISWLPSICWRMICYWVLSSCTVSHMHIHSLCHHLTSSHFKAIFILYREAFGSSIWFFQSLIFYFFKVCSEYRTEPLWFGLIQYFKFDSLIFMKNANNMKQNKPSHMN